jgi:P4 family phage/plasmid primase-like protien
VLPEKLDQAALMEFFGYCFLPSHRFETFLLLYGSTGANGKSVILEVMKAFFGRENVSSLQLHEFEGHTLTILKNKILNIGTEIESGGDLKKQFATLKALISPNDSIAMNPKNKDPYDLQPEEKPKLANAANRLPKSGLDGGVFRRALVLEMDQEIPDSEKVRDLVERFNDERAGILNMALEGLSRLIAQNGFSMSEKRKEFMESYKDDVNPVRAYLNECTEKAKGVCVPKKFVYEHYKAWAEDRGLQPYAMRTFWSKVKEQYKFKERFVTEQDYTHKLLGKKNRFIVDFQLKSDAIDEFKVKGESVKVENINLSSVGFVPVSL